MSETGKKKLNKENRSKNTLSDLLGFDVDETFPESMFYKIK